MIVRDHRGVLVTLDGPGGAGKSTTTRLVTDLLSDRGYRVHTTTEPSHATLGELARHGTDTYRGLSLACLVAADRYHHLDAEIRPHLAAGRIVLCDRYVASSYVLQGIDEVPQEFLHQLNAHADVPDLAVLLTAEPAVTAERIRVRGAHSRFESGLDAARTETKMFGAVAEELTGNGWPITLIDTTTTPVHTVAEQLAERIARTVEGSTVHAGPA